MPRASKRRTSKRRAHSAPDTLKRITRAFGVRTSSMRPAKVKELTDARRASIVGVSKGLIRKGLHLTPSEPRDGEDSLDFHSPMMVLCGKVSWSGVSLPTSGLALFSSKYWSIVRPTVQVEWTPGTPGAKYLVELYLSRIQKSEDYSFRIIPNPGGSAKDVTVGGNTTVLTEIVDTHSGYDGPYSVTFIQLDSKQHQRAWYFHKAIVTKVG